MSKITFGRNKICLNKSLNKSLNPWQELTDGLFLNFLIGTLLDFPAKVNTITIAIHCWRLFSKLTFTFLQTLAMLLVQHVGRKYPYMVGFSSSDVHITLYRSLSCFNWTYSSNFWGQIRAKVKEETNQQVSESAGLKTKTYFSPLKHHCPPSHLLVKLCQSWLTTFSGLLLHHWNDVPAHSLLREGRLPGQLAHCGGYILCHYFDQLKILYSSLVHYHNGTMSLWWVHLTSLCHYFDFNI